MQSKTNYEKADVSYSPKSIRFITIAAIFIGFIKN